MDSASKSGDWACVLRSEKAESVGFIVQFANANPINELSSLPGLTKHSDKSKKIDTSYALITCHHTIPGLESLIDWTLYCPAISQHGSCGVDLKAIVSECVTCCGKESSFMHSGKSTLHAHPGKIACDLKLNFTILFLNKHFETRYLGSVGSNSPPQVAIPQNDANLAHLQQALFGPNTRVVDAQSSDNLSQNASQAISCLQLLYPQIISDSNVRIAAIPIEIIKPAGAVDSDANLPSTAIRKGISEFQKVCTVSFRTSGHDLSSYPGCPIVYCHPETETIETVAIHSGLSSPSGDGEYLCVTIYGIMTLLQGGLIPCFAILKIPQAHRLWPHRWNHLLRPFFAEPVDSVCLLETLVLFMEKVGGMRLIELSARDPPPARISTLELIADLFDKFKSLSEEDVKTAMQSLPASADEFVSIIKGLCKAVIELVSNISGDQEPVKEQTEACFRCYRALLRFKYKGIIDILCEEKNLQHMEDLLKTKEKTATVLELLASIYRECCLITKHENASIQQKNDCLTAQVAQITTEKVVSLQDKNKEQHEQNQKLHQKLHDAQQKCEEAQEMINSLNIKVDVAEGDAANQRMMVESRDKRHQKLSEELTECQQKCQKLSEELTEAKSHHRHDPNRSYSSPESTSCPNTPPAALKTMTSSSSSSKIPIPCRSPKTSSSVQPGASSSGGTRHRIHSESIASTKRPDTSDTIPRSASESSESRVKKT